MCIRDSSKLLPAVLELFSTTAMEVCKGQQYDMDFEGRDQVTEGEYLDMIRLKTGVLIGCSLKMGAILAETSPGNANALYDFGMNLSLIHILLGVYDVRYNSSVDLQEYVDVGLSRSTDKGQTWEKMRLPLSFGEHGRMPKAQKDVYKRQE